MEQRGVPYCCFSETQVDGSSMPLWMRTSVITMAEELWTSF